MNDHNGSAPRYELRVRKRTTGDLELEVWQMRTPSTPHVKGPKRVAGLHGRNLALIEHRVARQLKEEGVDATNLLPGGVARFQLPEATALRLALTFRVLAPMRSRENMRACVEGIEAMEKEEASYWLGMTLHRKKPRRVLAALRCLLVDPDRQS